MYDRCNAFVNGPLMHPLAYKLKKVSSEVVLT